MSLERSLAIFFLALSIVYGVTAFFVIDAALPPFVKMSPIWPSTFPKVISVIGILTGFSLVFTKLKVSSTDASIKSYQWRPVIILLAMMIAYALLLRPVGFVVSTVCFITGGAMLLGERKVILLSIIAIVSALGIWYLVQQVLGIYLRPWPWFV